MEGLSPPSSDACGAVRSVAQPRISRYRLFDPRHVGARHAGGRLFLGRCNGDPQCTAADCQYDDEQSDDNPLSGPPACTR